MQTVVQKWGNSLGIRIPAVYAREFDLRNGSTVDIIESDGSLVIVPIDKKSLFRGTGTRPPACACPHADRLEPV